MFTTSLFYQGNHNGLVADEAHVTCPPYGLDFEFELGFVVCRDLRDPSPREARRAIGGFVILNDISLRDTQWEEIHGSPLGPTVKCKSFATAMSSEVVTADELIVVTADEMIDVIPSLSGGVLVDGEVWATGRTDDFAHPLEACVARSAAGESVFAGELLSTGTFAGCSGIEIGRLPRAGAQVTFRIDRLGTLTN
jgi:2-keto-4-pentenoate hydratase/2-oxohepta-3-ene-1,7-dioic acid hydratase in catechol pathway